MRKSYQYLLASAAIVLLRTPTFLQPLMEIDEAIYATIADLLLKGGVLYADGGVDHKPPLLYLIYQLCFWIGGRNNMLLVQVVNAATVLGTSYLLSRMTLMILRARGVAPRYEVMPYLLYGVSISSFYFEQMSANAEVFMNLLLTIGVFAFFVAAQERRRLAALLLSGLALSLAAYTKQTCALTYAALGVCLLLAPWEKRRIVRELAVFAAGGIVVTGAFVAYFAARGALHPYIYWVFLEPWLYLGGKSAADPSVVSRAVLHTAAIVGSNLFLFITATRSFAGAKARRARFSGASGWYVRLLILWVAVTIPQLMLGGRYLFHYYLLLMPPLCIAAGLLLEDMPSFAVPRWRRWLLAGALVPALLWTVVFPLHVTLQKQFGKFRDYRPVGEYIKANTAPDARIFVWGFSSEVYYYADRLPVTRFVFADLLAGILLGFGDGTPGYSSPEYWDAFASDLARQGNPELIVDTSPAGFHGYADYPMEKYPVLAALIASKYRFDREIGGMRLYRLSPGSP